MTKHILTGSTLTGYSCSVCQQSWSKETSVEDINAEACLESFDTSHSYTLSIANHLDHFYGWVMSAEDESLHTTADDKGKTLLERWERDNDG